MKKVIILLSTYNGERYLKEQLDSLCNQSYKNIEIYARDDGSDDNTLKILKSYPVQLLETTRNLGARDSFFELLSKAIYASNGDYFMFCDQDDVWDKFKVEKTLNKMLEVELNNPNIPILIHTDLEVVDKNLNSISKSMWIYEDIRPEYNSFNRLIIQNTITGCTVMIDRKLALKSITIAKNAVMHDWWIGLVASYFGKIEYLKESTIKYRQHDNNTIGAKNNSNINPIKLCISLLISLLKNIIGKDNRYIKDLDINRLQAQGFYDQYKEELDTKTKNMLLDFINIEKKNFFQRRFIIYKNKLYKQSITNNIALLIKI
ncbi:MAG: glycosyltransferase family 2 protein [Aliarcobacter sp.]|nr:glycosyltransferase family 2 protein [Aliarcobacter sp.]